MKNLIQTIILWAARIMAGSVLLFVLYMVGAQVVGINEASKGFQSATEVAMFLCFPIATCIGLFLAFKWEGLGGFISTLSLIGLAILNQQAFSGSTPFFIIFSIPGLLFMIYWLFQRGK